MRKIKEVLRLNASGASNRQIAQSLGISRPTVANYLARALATGLDWPWGSQWDGQMGSDTILAALSLRSYYKWRLE